MGSLDIKDAVHRWIATDSPTKATKISNRQGHGKCHLASLCTIHWKIEPLNVCASYICDILVFVLMLFSFDYCVLQFQ